jgi:hypothetical protein
MRHGCLLVALLVCMAASGPTHAQLQNCTSSACPCPFEDSPLPGGGTVGCEEPSFKCIPPPGCAADEIDGACVTSCNEIRGCQELCCESREATCSDPGCTLTTCETDPAECATCVPTDIINPCELAATFEAPDVTVACPGSGASGALPLVGAPSRDPFAFGIFALVQVKAEDVRFHRDVNAANGLLGPACHIGTNCNTTNTSSPYGTINLNQAVFPAGSQIVTGKVRWRAKESQKPALAAEVFSNDAVALGGDKACTVNDGRQLWCPIPLLRNRYPLCPSEGAQNDCANDTDGSQFCFCDDACHLEAHFDETIGVPNVVSAFESTIQNACNAAPGCPSVTVTPSEPQPRLLTAGCYSTVTVKAGATLSLKDGSIFPYMICHLKLEGGSSSSQARVVTDTTWSGGPLALLVNRLEIGNRGEFLWPSGAFRWDPADSGAPIAPSEVMVLAYSSTDPGISLADDVKAHGTFIAPRSDVNLGTRSSIRGRIVAGKKAVGAPDHVYCGCRGVGAECTQDNDCCTRECASGSCATPP